ncbi:kinase-like domain-containing protein [Trametes meyenii]|nr:kinase-like domain-containing protein [Trametes meyenii]
MVWIAVSRVLPIFPVSLRHWFWSKLIYLSTTYWEPNSTYAIAPIFGCIYIKRRKGCTRPEEAETTRFVRRHTSIPVPIIVDCFTVDGLCWIIMTALPGGPLDPWMNDLKEEDIRRIASQLSMHLAELRAIPPPRSGAVSAINNAPIQCCRLTVDGRPIGPFASIAEFNAYLCSPTLHVDRQPGLDEDHVWRTIRAAQSCPHKIVLTHNDLAPRNIMIDEDGNITGILDWECAAWLPEYWEYTKAHFTELVSEPFGGPWNDIMDSIFPQYALEKEAEIYLSQLHDW